MPVSGWSGINTTKNTCMLELKQVFNQVRNLVVKNKRQSADAVRIYCMSVVHLAVSLSDRPSFENSPTDCKRTEVEHRCML